jgi:hypothetical protein
MGFSHSRKGILRGDTSLSRQPDFDILPLYLESKYVSSRTFTMRCAFFLLGLALTAQEAMAGLMPRQFTTASLQCSQLVIDRIDPLVQPDIAPSTHMHQILGGDAFNVSMPALELDPSLTSTCTTCDFREDMSNYWTANSYFRAKNGTFKRVLQMVNLELSGREGCHGVLNPAI